MLKRALLGDLNRIWTIDINQVNTKVSPRSVKFGVSQGSIIRPLVFVIYINDFQNFLAGSSNYLYADDTAIMVNGRDSIELSQKLNAKSAKAYAKAEAMSKLINFK